MRASRSSGDCAVAEIVENGNAVRFGPYADRSGAGDVCVLLLYVALAVERHRNARANELDAQNVPAILRHRRIDVLDRDAVTALRVIKRNVVLQGVGAGDVVVI